MANKPAMLRACFQPIIRYVPLRALCPLACSPLCPLACSRDGRTGLLTDIVPCEDAYTSERTLYADILPLVQAQDLWLADRNFCTDDYLSGIAARDAVFLIRHHAGTKLHPLGPETRGRRRGDATISEQRVRAGCLECRCILIRLRTPLLL